MVTVIGYDKRLSEDGREFFTLTIQGSVEIVQSQNKNLYMTARKVNIPSTFDEEGCKLLIGKEILGKIKKVACEPYEYINKETGEAITLAHTYEYVEEEQPQEKPKGIPEFLPFGHGVNEHVPVTAQ